MLRKYNKNFAKTAQSLFTLLKSDLGEDNVDQTDSKTCIEERILNLF